VPTFLKIVIVVLLAPVVMAAVLWGYLWITYIDDTVTSGNKYGLFIGATKQKSFSDISNIQKEYPNLKIYIYSGKYVGDRSTLSPTQENYKKLEKCDRWELLLDGEGEFFNVIRMEFKHGDLVEIYRHRQYFEFP